MKSATALATTATRKYEWAFSQHMRPVSDYGLQCGVMVITALIASELLATNYRNRTARMSLVKKYARAFFRNEWALNGETVIISNTGVLMQGQHRLMACVQTGIPFTTLVVFGVDPISLDTIDTGKSRTQNDILKIDGVAHSAAVASACTLLFRHTVLGGINHRHIPPSLSELRKVFSNYPDLPAICDLVKGTKSVLASHGTAVALFAIFQKLDRDKAITFFSMLSNGVIGDKNSPILLLRNTLINSRIRLLASSKSGASDGQSKLHPIALTIKAWNAYVNGQCIKKLSYKTGEPFPLIGTESTKAL